MLLSVHNHGLNHELVGHVIVIRLNLYEKKIVIEITINMVQPKIILITLKQKTFYNVTNIKPY